MKLVRYGDFGHEKPGLIAKTGVLHDLSEHVPDIDGDTLSEAGLARLAALDTDALPKVRGEPRFGACVTGIGKYMCIGLNYSDHAADTGTAIPENPILFR